MKTNKEKCLKMWEWLRDHPGNTKKYYFENKSIPINERPHNLCFACESAITRTKKYNPMPVHFCLECPIHFPSKYKIKDKIYPVDKLYPCAENKSPYRKWSEIVCSLGFSSIVGTPEVKRKPTLSSYKEKFLKKHADDIIKLIKETWKE